MFALSSNGIYLEVEKFISQLNCEFKQLRDDDLMFEKLIEESFLRAPRSSRSELWSLATWHIYLFYIHYYFFFFPCIKLIFSFSIDRTRKKEKTEQELWHFEKGKDALNGRCCRLGNCIDQTHRCDFNVKTTFSRTDDIILGWTWRSRSLQSRRCFSLLNRSSCMQRPVFCIWQILNDCMKDVGKFRQYVYYIGTSCDTSKLRNKIQKLKERINRSFTNQRELLRKTAAATAS